MYSGFNDSTLPARIAVFSLLKWSNERKGVGNLSSSPPYLRGNLCPRSLLVFHASTLPVERHAGRMRGFYRGSLLGRLPNRTCTCERSLDLSRPSPSFAVDSVDTLLGTGISVARVAPLLATLFAI